ncbi:PrtD family type I secretion system ABC transporter [Bradyrhizobium sp. GM5.1]
MRLRDPAGKRSELGTALRAYRAALLGIGLISAVINILYLTGSFFMLEIYDRVLPSRSLPTLVGLACIAALLYAFQGFFDLARGRIMVRIGVGLDEALSARVYGALLEMSLRGRPGADALQPLRDLDQIRAFLSGGGPLALFDLPWMPLYLVICFAFHFWIGMAALVGACVLICLAALNEILSRTPAREAVVLGAHRNGLAESSRRNAEVVRAMGMGATISRTWGEINTKFITKQRQAADIAGGLGAISKVLRMLLQSAVLAVGAYLVIQQQSTAGIIIAGSILTARALAPVELAIANWRVFLGARQSWTRLSELLRIVSRADDRTKLSPPSSTLAIENISVVPPGSQIVVLQDVTLVLKAGEALGVVGPSASGKSSFVRALVGVWPTFRGKVRIDGAALEQWSADLLGRHIGYLPQDVELFEGTVAQNISRFEVDPVAEAVVEAAMAAGVHKLILRLPDGYDTQVGEGGTSLSAGQRQRLALARALYKAPFLVVLDEPNSNLDQEGEIALGQAILHVREQGGILVIVAHRPSMLANVDKLLVLSEGGRVLAFGPKDEVVEKVLRPGPVTSPLTVVSQKS